MILPYLKVNVVVFALNFYEDSFQLHHKTFTHATVLWKDIKVRELGPFALGKGRAAADLRTLGFLSPLTHPKWSISFLQLCTSRRA